MKKIMLKKLKPLLVISMICASIFLLSNNKVYADYGDGSIGIAFYGGYPYNMGGIFNFKFDDVPVMFGLNISDLRLDNYNLRVNVITDWWALNSKIIGPLHYYLGPGVSFLFDIKNDYKDFDFALALRIPIGLALVFGPFEIYGEIAPSIKILDVPSEGSTVFFPQDELFVFSGQAGIRLWF